MRARRWAWPLLILAALAVAYARGFQGQFLFDDYSSLVDNPAIRRLWPLSQAVTTAPEIALAQRPVAAYTFALNYALHGLEVRGYHAVNLGLHALCALLAFGILRRLLAQLNPPLRDAATPLAGMTALLWGIHPLLTESVMYVVQRTELLMAACLLGTLYCVVRRAAPGASPIWSAGAVASCALGMGSKESMVVAPLVAGMIDATLLTGSWRLTWQRRPYLYVGLAATWLVVAALVAQGARTTTAGFGVQGLSPWRYALTQAEVWWHYLRLVFWPQPLIVDYGDWPWAHGPRAWAAASAILGLLALTLHALRRRRLWAPAAAWVLLTLAPTSSVLPILTEPAAERRMYLPLLAIIVALVVFSWQRLAGQPAGRRRLAAGVLALAVLGLMTLTLMRVEVYRSEERLLRDLLHWRPQNARAHYNLGVLLAEQERYAEASEAFRAALHWRPHYAAAHSNLAAALMLLGDRAEALAHYRTAHALQPQLLQAQRGLEALQAP